MLSAKLKFEEMSARLEQQTKQLRCLERELLQERASMKRLEEDFQNVLDQVQNKNLGNLEAIVC